MEFSIFDLVTKIGHRLSWRFRTSEPMLSHLDGLTVIKCALTAQLNGCIEPLIPWARNVSYDRRDYDLVFRLKKFLSAFYNASLFV